MAVAANYSSNSPSPSNTKYLGNIYETFPDVDDVNLAEYKSNLLDNTNNHESAQENKLKILSKQSTISNSPSGNSKRASRISKILDQDNNVDIKALNHQFEEMDKVIA